MERERYWVALFNEGGEHAGVQRELARCFQPEEAYLKYSEYAELIRAVSSCSLIEPRFLRAATER